MNESVFKTKAEPERVIVPEEKPTEFQNRELTSEDTLPEKNYPELELWEAENQKKYINEVFDTHEIGHDFKWKMPLAKIDKFVRAEITERKYANTTENYRNILNEIESEIGSEKLETWERLQKIANYISALGNYRKAKEKKELFKTLL